MKIAITGTRGLPANYGGFETFAEELGKRLTVKEEVLIVGDSSNTYSENSYRHIQTRNSKYSKSKNPLQFYHDSLKIAEDWGADIAIMCGVGGVFSVPFFNNSKMKILVNPDGLGWKREKWVWWKKAALYAQFLFCAKFVEYIVCDSEGIKTFFETKFKRKKNLYVAEYGSNINPFVNQNDPILFDREVGNEFNITSKNYYLVVSRLEPENNVEMIIQGYVKSGQRIPLIIVGNTNTVHAKHLLQYKSENVRFVEGVYDPEKLSALRYYSKGYFHGHSVGGTNPSLLEAMGSGNLCIAHDNIFNREVLNDKGFFFKNENEVLQIVNYIETGENEQEIEKIRSENLDRITEYYNWEDITHKYEEIFATINNAK